MNEDYETEKNYKITSSNPVDISTLIKYIMRCDKVINSYKSTKFQKIQAKQEKKRLEKELRDKRN